MGEQVKIEENNKGEDSVVKNDDDIEIPVEVKIEASCRNDENFQENFNDDQNFQENFNDNQNLCDIDQEESNFQKSKFVDSKKVEESKDVKESFSELDTLI